MQSQRYDLHDRARLVEEFTNSNSCDECYVAIRSNLDKTFPQLLGENVKRYFSFGSSAKRSPDSYNGEPCRT